MKGAPQFKLEELLEQYEGLDHLSVKRRGNSLTVYSSGKEGQQNHAKFTSLGGSVWGLSFPHHTGRWEKTPFMGSLEELVGTLVENFGYYLE
jgi:hypothetical protein